MRKIYIDNIRIICILLLFPFHTFMLYNSWGEPFYVYSTPVSGLSQFNVMIYPWWMNLLFAIAGISSAYALNRRSGKEYIKERITKLLIPLLFGILLIIPVQCYIADIFHNGYSGGYFEHYKVFFTKFTDLSGNDGGFTPAHTWFMLYLLVISMIALPIMLWYTKREKKINGSRITMPVLLPMFLIILLLTPILEIAGKSIGESLACFLLGFFVLSLEGVQDKLLQYRVPLGISWILLMFMRDILFHIDVGLLADIQSRLLSWIGIMAVLGLGKRYLNFNNSITKYLSPAAFPIYLFHQSVLVIVGYFTLMVTDSIPLQILSIILISFLVTLICYEGFRRFTVTCFMFGIKRKERQNAGYGRE